MRQAINSLLQNYTFWNKISIITTLINGVMILMSYFDAFLEEYFYVYFSISIIAIPLFLLSQAMRFIIKRRNKIRV